MWHRQCSILNLTRKIIKQRSTGILSISIENLVSLSRYLLFVGDLEWSDLLLVDVAEGVFDSGLSLAVSGVFDPEVFRDFFACSGDKNDFFSNEWSLFWSSIDLRIKRTSESDFVATVLMVTLNEQDSIIIQRKFDVPTSWYFECFPGNDIRWRLSLKYLLVIEEKFFLSLMDQLWF